MTPDEPLRQIQECAQAAGLAPGEPPLVDIEARLAQAQADFERAADYLLNKNRELYRRLGIPAAPAAS